METIEQALMDRGQACHKMTIRLRPDEKRWLTGLAVILGVSEGEVVRQTLRRARLMAENKQVKN